MRYKCKAEVPGAIGCPNHALPNRELCRWHAIATRYVGSGTARGRYSGYLSVLAVVLVASSLIALLSGFVREGGSERLALAVFFLAILATTSGYGAIMLGSTRVFWAKAHAVGLVSTGVMSFFLVFLSVSEPGVTSAIVSDLSSAAAGIDVLLVRGTLIVIGVFMFMTFLGVVLMRTVPVWLQVAVILAYLGFMLTLALTGRIPTISIFFLALYVIYLLEGKLKIFSRLKRASEF